MAVGSHELLTHILELPDLTDVISISVRGQVDYRNAGRLRRVLLDEISKTWASRVVVELGSVDRMDTAAAAVLVEAIMESRRNEKQLLLCTPSESVVRTFRLAGIEEALEACCSNPAETRRRLLAPGGEPAGKDDEAG